MQLSATTLDRLANIITGDGGRSPRRSGPQLIDFFREFGERDLYGPGFPSRHAYTIEKLSKFNGSEAMKKIVSKTFDFFHEEKFHPEAVADQFNNLLHRDGYRLALEYASGFMQGDRYTEVNPYFDIKLLEKKSIKPERLVSIDHEAIAEQIAKANSRIRDGDYSGAITSVYTLVEQLLKVLIREILDTKAHEEQGDIRTLYQLVRDPLNLNPAADNIAKPLKPILDGLQKLISGLYEISNKAGDRHATRYKASEHHAKLAVNSAFTLCEFLIESYDHQRRLSNQKQSI